MTATDSAIRIRPALEVGAALTEGPAGGNSKAADRSYAAASLVPCVHCGQQTQCPSSQDPATVFCCHGCRGAYELIRGWGLEDFYALREQSRLIGSAQAACQIPRYERFDTVEYLGRSAPVRCEDGSCVSELAVHGLHCGACTWLIENAALHEPGVLSTRVKLSNHTVQIIFDPQQTQLSQIARFMDRLGYQLSPYDPVSDAHIHLENRRQLTQIAIAGFLAANAMWIAIALYAGEFSGVAEDHRFFLGLIGTALGISAVAGPGRVFFVGAFASLKTLTPHMDLPVALGLLVGSLVGITNALSGRGHVYFDSLATLVFLLLIGRWIQFRQQQRAARSVDLLLRLTPRHADLVHADDSTKNVMVDSLIPGDVIQVAPRESVPADGEIVFGQTNLDRALLTGESIPVTAGVGDLISAGEINQSAPIRVRVSAVGRNSRIGRVMQSVETAANEKTPLVMLADRIGGYFVVVVMTLAAVTFLGWLPTDLQAATAHATALLIVACPCALALATPLAIAVALGKASKSGILIRDGSALQRLARPGRLWLDKTGTLTHGQRQVTAVVGSVEALRLAAAVERQCSHPVADAIVRETQSRELEIPHDGRFECVVTGGVIGCVSQRRICVGNMDFMRCQNITVSPAMLSAVESRVENGESPILIAVDASVVTVLGLSDPLRSEAPQVVQRLVQLGWKVGILSGDHPDIVWRIGATLGLERQACHGSLSPEEKLAMIRDSLGAGDSVVMVGDGANDAAALAAADVGIAVRGGAEVSLQAAPIFVATGTLRSLTQLVEGASNSTRLIWLTFIVSLLYNTIAVGLAMAGWISPLIAAVLMPASSISVLAITLAAKTFEGART